MTANQGQCNLSTVAKPCAFAEPGAMARNALMTLRVDDCHECILFVKRSSARGSFLPTVMVTAIV